MKVRQLTVILIGAALIQGCVEHHVHSGICRGRVVDADTQAPLKRATVELDGGQLRASTKSGEDGSFAVGPLRCSHFGIVIPPEPHVIPGCKHDIPPSVWLNVFLRHYALKELLVPTAGTNGGDVFLHEERRSER